MSAYTTAEKIRINFVAVFSLAVSLIFFFLNLYEISSLYYIGLAGLLISIVAFSGKEMFLMISFLIPNLFMFKQIGSESAILGYFFVALSLKELVFNFKTNLKVSLFFVLHIVFALVTCTIYSDRSLLIALVRFCFNFSLFAYYASLFSQNGDIKQIAKMYFCGIITAVVMGIIFHSNRGDLYNGLFSGINSGRNYFGAVITPTLTLVVFYFLEKKATFLESVLYIATIVLCLTSVVLSGSRTSVLSLIIPILMLIFYLFKFNSRLIPLVLLLAVIVIYVYNNYLDSIMYLILRFGDEDVKTGNNRFELWQYYIQQAFQTPITFLFGSGSINERVLVEHNTIVQCFYELGVTGLITLFGFIKQTFRRIINGSKVRFVALFPFVSVMIPYCGINGLYADQFSFLLILCALIMKDFSKPINAVDTDIKVQYR